jgi:sugar phosphate isomerase/epimerase
MIDGVLWNHGLGYFPHVALWEDPVLLRKQMERYGIEFTQVDAAFPLSRPEGASLGLEYVLHTIRWAKMTGCPRVDTTDDRKRPQGMTDREGIEHLRRIYAQIVPIAEVHKIIVNIEPHGYFTTNPEFLAEMLAFSDSPYLRVNLDTGNTFIAGQDPVAFLARFQNRVDHLHIKDVSPNLAGSARGKLTGIATSHCAIGDGVNSTNIRRIIEMLAANGYDGVLSMECEGQGGPMIERSLAWLRETVKSVLAAPRS